MQDIKKALADEAVGIVCGARRSAYGKPEDNFARIARFWTSYFQNLRIDIEITPAMVSPMMRLMKEARLCESPDHRDSFVDLIGYTLTGAEINLGAGSVEKSWSSDLTDSPEEAEVLERVVEAERFDPFQPKPLPESFWQTPHRAKGGGAEPRWPIPPRGVSPEDVLTLYRQQVQPLFTEFASFRAWLLLAVANLGVKGLAHDQNTPVQLARALYYGQCMIEGLISMDPTPSEFTLLDEMFDELDPMNDDW